MSELNDLRCSVNEQLVAAGDEILVVLDQSQKPCGVEEVTVFVKERLAAVAYGILVQVERLINMYKQEIALSRLRDIALMPQIILHRADAKQLLVCKQEWSPSQNQEEPELPHIKVEQEELWTSQNQEEPELPHIKVDQEELWTSQNQEEPELPHIKVDQEELWTSQNQEEQELHHIKVDQEELWTSQNQEEPELHHIKVDQEELWTSQNQEEQELHHIKVDQEELWTSQNQEEPELHHIKVDQEELWTSQNQEEQELHHIKVDQEELWTSQEQLHGLNETDIRVTNIVSIKSECDCTEKPQSVSSDQSETAEERDDCTDPGRGVLAMRVLNKRDDVLECSGKLFKQDRLHTKNCTDTEDVVLFDFQWKGKYCLDASVEEDSLGRVVNDKLNCKMTTVEVGGMPRLCLFALRDIAQGEKITCTHGDATWPRHTQKLSPDVREQIVDDRGRPQSLASSDTSSPDESTKASDLLEDVEPASKAQTTSYTKASLEETDHTVHSNRDCALDPEAGQSSEIDVDAPQCPVAVTPPPSRQCPPLSPAKMDIERPVKRNAAVHRKKVNSDTPGKREISSPSPLRNNSNTPQQSSIQEVCDPIRVLPPTNSEKHRVYNKRNYCLFCLKPTTKFARHLEARHGNVAEVAIVFQYPKNSKERRSRLNILRSRGNFAHNTNVVREGSGELQACYRPRQCRRAFDFSHCSHCQGLYSKKTLWKHMKICPARKETVDESSKCARKTAVVREIGEGLKSVISCMTYDDITRVIEREGLLLQFGQHLFDLNGSKRNRHHRVRQRLRELGRLLLAAQENTPIRKAEELVNPVNLKYVVSAVKTLAGYNPKNHTFSASSLALKIGKSLCTMSKLVESDNLSTVNREWSLVEFAREFKTIKKLFTRGATTTLKESKWNAPQIIPFTEDVKHLDSHLENVKGVAERMLRVCPTVNNYETLAEVTLAQLIFFNRRRAGEVSKMELDVFKARKRSELNEDMVACLSPLENKMCDFFTRVEMRGKHGRRVPVLLTRSMISAMELLADTREVCGVSRDNVFMFARPGASSSYRGGELIQKFASESGVKHPEVLTSAGLRNHIATLSWVLNLQQNEDQLADFLGPDICVYKQYCHLPQGTLQLAKISKVFLAVEKGTLSQYKGQNLDDIEIDPEEKVDSSHQEMSSDEDESVEVTDENSHRSPETIAPSLSNSSPSSTSASATVNKDNRGASKRKWEDHEVLAVEGHMMRFIHTCKVPQKIDCIQCINAEPYALKDRNWTGVKNYIRNRITALKRKACAQDKL